MPSRPPHLSHRVKEIVSEIDAELGESSPFFRGRAGDRVTIFVARSRDSLRARELAFAPDEREEDVREESREEAPPVGRFFAVGFFLAPCMATMASQNDQRSIHTFAQIVAERQNQHGQMTAVLKMRTAF